MHRSLIVIIILIPFLQACSFSLLGECENFVEKEVVSPNGKLKAVIFDRGCGATVGFITGISILSAEEKLSNTDTGNVLLADHIYRSNNASGEKEVVYYETDWVTDGQLSVLYTESEMLSKQDKFNDVKIYFTKINR